MWSPVVTTEEINTSDIVPQAAGNSESCQIILCITEQEFVPSEDKAHLLFPTWQLLWRSRGVRGCCQMETGLLMHLPSFTVEYGIWHFCCGVDGLNEEWLTGRRGLWMWQSLASWRYRTFPNHMSAPSYTFKEETSLPRVLRFWDVSWYPFMQHQPPVAAALAAGLVRAGDRQPFLSLCPLSGKHSSCSTNAQVGVGCSSAFLQPYSQFEKQTCRTTKRQKKGVGFWW